LDKQSKNASVFFQRVKDPYAREYPEALASRKVVYREVFTEGSETAKSGTDEQKRHMRPVYLGKQPLACNAPKEKKKKERIYR